MKALIFELSKYGYFSVFEYLIKTINEHCKYNVGKKQKFADYVVFSDFSLVE